MQRVLKSMEKENIGLDNASQLRTHRIVKLSASWATKLCTEERIEEAIFKANTWLIPADAKKPEDPRRVRKTGQ